MSFWPDSPSSTLHARKSMLSTLKPRSMSARHFVMRHHVLCGGVGIGDQQEFAVEQFQIALACLIYREAGAGSSPVTRSSFL